MLTLPAIIDDYLEAYCDPNRARRAAAIERVFAPAARLIDPPLAAEGHGPIAAQADALLAQFPGHRFRRSTGVDAHHHVARYGWQLVDPNGRVVLEGCDFVEVETGGRLAQVSGFFGALPALEAA